MPRKKLDYKLLYKKEVERANHFLNRMQAKDRIIEEVGSENITLKSENRFLKAEHESMKTKLTRMEGKYELLKALLKPIIMNDLKFSYHGEYKAEKMFNEL